ncbi:hypothetical protein ACFFMN_33770 [Planobispora siamensis]|uniref:Uncharacterized protein n=1 Tax=Planobispora siamensis TaxID=936338 RepID=A0A8J3SF86_9ACTN|nr:hypothetical protein [Planobispora siamensis]GIH91980.1 hypothetical protein Psi01_26100 [Planobispora siamensis]
MDQTAIAPPSSVDAVRLAERATHEPCAVCLQCLACTMARGCQYWCAPERLS